MATPIKMTDGVPAKLLGARIKRARKTAGLSHDNLGASADASRQYLIALEQGKHKPSDDLLARIARATGKPLEFFTRKPAYKPQASRELNDGDREKLADATAGLAAALLEIVRDKIASLEVDLEEVDAA